MWIHSWNHTSARGVAHELGMSCFAKNNLSLSVKAKAQQLMYGFMGYILYFDRGYLFSGVVVTAVRSNWLRAPQDLNACDWVPSFTIGSTGSRPSTHGTRAASLSDRALSSWQALKK